MIELTTNYEAGVAVDGDSATFPVALPSLPEFAGPSRGGRGISPPPPREPRKSDSRPSSPRPPSVVRDERSYCNYMCGSFLGKGGFASVWQYRLEGTNDHFALKVVEKCRLTKQTHVDKLHREINIHRECDHPNIVKLKNSFGDMDNIYILMELCPNGTLLDRINNSHGGCLTAQECFNYTSGVVDAVLYLFRRDILHRDLKPGNVFLTGETVKLGDFGLAVHLRDYTTYSISGTPNYLAPEVLRREGHSKASEAWAIGCIMYCMLTGKPPFETDNLQKTYSRIAKGKFMWPHEDELQIDLRAIAVVNRLLLTDVDKRQTVEGIPTCSFYLAYQQIARSNANLRAPPSCDYTGFEVDSNANALSYLSLNSQKFDSQHSLHNGHNQFFNNNNFPLIDDLQSQRIVNDGGYNGTPTRTYREHISVARPLSAHDSGMGSDPHLLSPRNEVNTALEFYYRQIERMFSSRQHLYEVPSSDVLFVSKWVDYSNKFGFGCILSDGCISILFLNDQVISVSRDEQVVRYGDAPLSWSIKHYYANNSSVLPLDVLEAKGIADLYRVYMEKELAGAVVDRDGDGWAREAHVRGAHSTTDLAYLAHQVKQGERVMMLLSDGTVQVNFCDEHMKMILSRRVGADGHCSMLISIIDQTKQMKTYRLCNPGYDTIRPDQGTMDLLSTMRSMISTHTSRVRYSPTEGGFDVQRMGTQSSCMGSVATAC